MFTTTIPWHKFFLLGAVAFAALTIHFGRQNGEDNSIRASRFAKATLVFCALWFIEHRFGKLIP